MKENSNNIISIKKMTLTAMFSAIICIAAPFSIPIGPIPLSLTSLVIYFCVYICGKEICSLSYGIYLLIGVAGMPVFSGFTGGPSKLLGPTGGYLIGFFPLIFITGYFIEKSNNKIIHFLGMAAGTSVCYISGTAWLAYETHITFQAALLVGTVPFIAGDMIKIIIVTYLGPALKKSLVRLHIL